MSTGRRRNDASAEKAEMSVCVCCKWTALRSRSRCQKATSPEKRKRVAKKEEGRFLVTLVDENEMLVPVKIGP
jgi:hypothetical protein